MYWTGSTLPTRSWLATNSTRARSVASVVQGVKGSQEGRTSMASARSTATAAASSAVVCPLSRRASVVSSTHSNSLTTNRQPAAAITGQVSRWARMCSTLTVQSKVTSRTP